MIMEMCVDCDSLYPDIKGGACVKYSMKIVPVVLFALLMALAGFPAAQAETEMVTLDFIDAAGISMGHADCTVISGDYCVFGSPGWYAVTEDVSFSDRIIIETEMNLILCNGATLT